MFASLSFLYDRGRLEYGLLGSSKFSRVNQATQSYIDRLGLENSLHGHQGCVNCLQWNDEGSLLASGSDDCCVMLWDIRSYQNRLSFATGHTGNIFSVKFIHKDSMLATCAGDLKVRVHDIEKTETVMVFNCHSGRVKQLATVPVEPFTFLSAAEDGTVRHFDIRCPQNSDSPTSANVLIDLTAHIGAHAEAKCLAINPYWPHMLAVGSNDGFVRVYDRRKLFLHALPPFAFRIGQTDVHAPNASQLPYDATQYYVPGHIPRKDLSHANGLRTINTTHLTFSPDGRDLLVNLGGEQIYIFSTRGHRAPLNFSVEPESVVPEWTTSLLPHYHLPSHNRVACDDQVNLEAESARASHLVESKSFVDAVQTYNAAIARWPQAAKLFTGRAAAFIKRGWDGDIYAALRDCVSALSLVAPTLSTACDEDAQKLVRREHCLSKCECLQLTAQLLMVRCLLRLAWVKGARKVLNALRERYLPDGSAAPVDMASVKNGSKPSSTGSSGDLCLLYQLLDSETLKIEATCNNVKYQNQQQNSNLVGLVTNSDLTTPVNPLSVTANAVNKSPKCPNEIFPEVSMLVDETGNMVDECLSVVDSSVNSGPSPVELVRKKRQSTTEADEDEDSEEVSKIESILTTSRNSSKQDAVCSCSECSTERFSRTVPLSSTQFFERRWREEAIDYESRFLGHCNITTDIKEANFFGGDGQFIVAGSDCGSLFIWDRWTTNIRRILQADSATVNCVQPHPSTCLIASSGIDNVIRIWSPQPEGKDESDREVRDHVGAAEANHERLRADPLEVVLRHIGYRLPTSNNEGSDAEEVNDSAAPSTRLIRRSNDDDDGSKSSDSHYDSLPVVPGGALTDPDLASETSNCEIAAKERVASEAPAFVLEPPVAACALESEPLDTNQSDDQSSAVARRVMAHILVGTPGEPRTSGAVIFQAPPGSRLRRRRRQRQRTRTRLAYRGSGAGEENEAVDGSGGDSDEEMDAESNVFETDTVFGLPCTTS